MKKIRRVMKSEFVSGFEVFLSVFQASTDFDYRSLIAKKSMVDKMFDVKFADWIIFFLDKNFSSAKVSQITGNDMYLICVLIDHLLYLTLLKFCLIQCNNLQYVIMCRSVCKGNLLDVEVYTSFWKTLDLTMIWRTYSPVLLDHVSRTYPIHSQH